LLPGSTQGNPTNKAKNEQQVFTPAKGPENIEENIGGRTLEIGSDSTFHTGEQSGK